jgi:aspartyl/asparaginyl-tRNA synthetase
VKAASSQTVKTLPSAEPHDTPRHLNEYVSLDAEMGFIEDHTTVMALLERVIGGMLAQIAADNDCTPPPPIATCCVNET